MYRTDEGRAASAAKLLHDGHQETAVYGFGEMNKSKTSS
jgi:hypothetical protein